MAMALVVMDYTGRYPNVHDNESAYIVLFNFCILAFRLFLQSTCERSAYEDNGPPWTYRRCQQEKVIVLRMYIKKE